MLTQEMSVKVDQGFLNAVLTLFSSGEVDEDTERQLMKADMAVVERPLMDYAVQSTADEQKHFYDMLHVSPLKVTHPTYLVLFYPRFWCFSVSQT